MLFVIWLAVFCVLIADGWACAFVLVDCFASTGFYCFFVCGRCGLFAFCLVVVVLACCLFCLLTVCF